MLRRSARLALLLLVAVSACSRSSESPSSEPDQAAAAEEPAAAAAPATAPTLRTASESHDILERDQVTAKAEVRHVLIGWAELATAYGGNMDARARERTRAGADDLAARILERAVAGDDFTALMKTYSEDWGSADSGTSYTAEPDAGLVEPFKRLSLRLQVGESGLVLSRYGWHVIKRFE